MASTDKEKLLELLESFGIKPGNSVYVNSPQLVVLEVGTGGVDGHPYFHCVFEFNEDESFESVGIWE